MCLIADSDEGDSDPVEEPPAGRVRRLRNPRIDNAKPNALLTKKKQVLARSARKRLLTLSGFKIIKPPAVPVGVNEKKTWQLPVISDGFEGSERLPTSRNPRSTKARRRPRQQITLPTLYYKALEIVESEIYKVDFLKTPETPQHAWPAALDVEIAHHAMEDVVVSAALSDDLLREAESGPAIPVDAHKVVQTIELDPVNVEQETPQHLDPQAMKMSKASAQESQAEISMPDVSFQAIGVDQELARVLEEEGEEMEVEGNKEVQSHQEENDADSAEAPRDMSGGMQTDSAPRVEEPLPKHPGQTQDLGLPPPATLFVNHNKKRPLTIKIRRQVTFSDEVEIQTVVELESEEEYESESEEQSQGSDSESDKSQSTHNEAEKSQQDDDDSYGSDDDADDEDDDEEGGGYLTTKLDNRIGSPELVSSGYHVESSSPAQPHFISNSRGTQSIASTSSDDDILEDGIMMLDVDDEINELPDSPQYTPQYTPQSRKYLEEIADSEDEMLILTSRATSAERMVPGSEGVVDTDYDGEDKSDGVLEIHSRPSEDANGPADIPSAWASGHNLTRPAEPFFGIARSRKGVQTKLADSGLVMTPPTTYSSFVALELSRGSQTAPITPPLVYRKIKRAKTGLQRHGSPPIRKIPVRDVPSYFTQASQALSSPLKNAQIMMRRARTLPST